MSTNANVKIADVSNLTPIANSADWRQAAQDLIGHWVDNGECFSSGEVASALRVHRPDLRFSVPSLGEHIRDLFYSNALPGYPDADPTCGKSPVTMSPRFTVGLFPDRTPAGVQVFVYGPEVGACDAHEFEVFIPNPAKGETMADAPAPAKTRPEPARGSMKSPITIGGSKTPVGDVVATVWPDGRLCVPRAAFEAAVHLAGNPIKGGDPVFVQCDAQQATITLVDLPGTTRYDLWTTQGRIAFANPAKPFTPGDKHTMVVESGKITVKF